MLRVCFCLATSLLLTTSVRTDEPRQPVSSSKSGTELHGTVHLADGTPASGADVWAAANDIQQMARVQGKTDGEGRFRLELPNAPDEIPFWSIHARLGNQGGEAMGSWGELQIWKGGKPRPVTIRLEERGVVKGRVLQVEDDKPLAGAKLFLDSGEILTTAADGSFRISGYALRTHSVVVVAPGRMCRHTWFDTTLRPQAELELRLDQGRRLTGRVTDEEGKPVPNARFYFFTSGNSLSQQGCQQPCNPDGSFILDVVSPHHRGCILYVGAPGFSRESRHIYSLRPGVPTSPLTFILRRSVPQQLPQSRQGREVTGVVQTSDGKPFAGAAVRWIAAKESRGCETQTDAQGRFTIRDLPARDIPVRDSNTILVLAEGFAPQTFPVPSDAKTINVTLTPGKDVEGIVRKPNGEPLANVSIVPKMDRWVLTPLATKTDATGKYLLRSMPPQFELDMLRPDLQWPSRKVVRPADGAIETVMKLKGGVYGQVLDPQGKPVRNFRIRCEGPRNPPPEKPGADRAGFGNYYSDPGFSFTSDDGSFILSGLGVGSHVRVSAFVLGYGKAVYDAVPVKALDELPLQPLVFQLKPPHQLRVRLVDARNDKPISGGLITLMDDSPRLDQGMFHWGYHDNWGFFSINHSQRTGADGWASLEKLTCADAMLIVECSGFARQRLGWRNGEKELTVQLQPEAILEVEVKGASWAGVGIGNESRQTYMDVATLDRGMKTEFTQIPAGNYTLQVNTSNLGGKPVTQNLTLNAGERRKIVVDLTEKGK